MDSKFSERASWFLTQVRGSNYPSANDLAKQFSVSAKTASRIISKLRNEYEAPLVYSATHKGYELSDPDFRLPCNCALSDEELRVLALAVARFKEQGEGDEAKLVHGLLKRLVA